MIFKSVKNSICVCYRSIYGRSFVPLELEPGQYPYPKRQIPLDGLKSFDERMQEIRRAKTEMVLNNLNIGYNLPIMTSNVKKDKSANLEMLARKRQISIDVTKLDNATKDTLFGIRQRTNIARLYNIYNDIFTYPHFFYPIKSLDVSFSISDDLCVPIFNGNMISPATASFEPLVQFDSDDNSLWTLIMSSPDENLKEDKKEYIHWMISNISMKDSRMVIRDVIVPYLQPIPYLGTGFHRYVVVLYKQDRGRIDLSSLSLPEDCHLEDRTFSSFEFLRNHQDSLTPTGLSFFQSSWDHSVRQCFRDKLNCLEPLFEYKWPKDKLKQQQPFPEGKVMHKYLDQYRDTKDIEQEVLKERLKLADPFSLSKPLEYPLAVPEDVHEMGFVKDKFKDKQLRRDQWKSMDIVDEF